MHQTGDFSDYWEHKWYWSRWELKLPIFPRWCHLSGKRLWLKLAYRGELVITGPGDPVVEYRWHDKHEHLVWKLMGGTKY